MKKLIIVLMLVLVAGFVGCSKQNPIAPTVDEKYPSGAQRPAFIDTRPADVIQQYTLVDAQPVALDNTPTKATKYALVIGINAYAAPNTLKNCVNDANDWATYLTGKGYTVTKLLDKAATQAGITTAVNNLAAKAIAGNTIVFMYSGHGSYSSSNSNFISQDLYYMSATWITSKFANAASTKMFFSFDACQIGQMKTKLAKTGDTTMKNGVFTYYQMLGFSSQGYTYAEGDASYACTQMKNWGTANGCTCAPSYGDSYTGNWTF